MSDKYGTSPSVIRLTNNQIIKQTPLVDGTIQKQELGARGGATTKIRKVTKELTD